MESVLLAGSALLIVGILLTLLAKKKEAMRHLKPTAVALGLVAVLVAAAIPASADNVIVAVDNPGGSRAFYVEDLAGNPLTTLDFGTDRSMPFRVRVVDDTMDREAINISATMTNLFIDDDGTIDYTKKIASSNLDISNATNPLNVLDVEATVRPLVTTVSSIANPAICLVLGFGVVGSCEVTVEGLTGVAQTLTVPVDLDDLTNLPLLPTQAEVGSFERPDFVGIGAGDLDKPSDPATWLPTPRKLLGGSVISTEAVLEALEGAVDSAPRDDLIADVDIINGIGEKLLGFANLTAAQITTVLNSTVATVQDLLPAQVTAQTGTYMSFPKLNVTVPEDASRGAYKGTLVVTALQ